MRLPFKMAAVPMHPYEVDGKGPRLSRQLPSERTSTFKSEISGVL